MLVNTREILPSQNFLKANTVRFIFSCIQTGNTAELPPTPLVRQRGDGVLVAIDGHNLIAVRDFLGQPVEVEIAQHAHDGLEETSDANKRRNEELGEKFDTVLEDQLHVAAEGVQSFEALRAKYPELFTEELRTAYSVVE